MIITQGLGGNIITEGYLTGKVAFVPPVSSCSVGFECSYNGTRFKVCMKPYGEAYLPAITVCNQNLY